MKVNTDNIPKIFWKYFDLYRRKKITLEQFVEKTGLTYFEVKVFLDTIMEKNSEIC